MKITVIGQGYVGLPLAMACVFAGLDVVGIDKNKEKVIARVRLNQQRIKDLAQLGRLKELKEQGLITYDFDRVSKEELLSNLQILGGVRIHKIIFF